MLATGCKVETPFAVATLVETYEDSDGRKIARVKRVLDGAEQHFDLECVTPYRVYEVGDVVRVYDRRGNIVACDGYGVIVHRSNCGHLRHAYEVRMDDAEDGHTRWANLATLRTVGSRTGNYPAWDNLPEILPH